MVYAIRNRGWTGGGLTIGYRMAAFAIALLGLALFVFMSPWGVGAQAGADVSAQVPAQILAERLVDVAVDVDNLGSDNLKSAQVIVTYDPARLAPQQITPGDLFDTDCTEENSIDPAAGQISLFFDCDNAQSGSPLNLWNIEFFAGPVTSPTDTDLFVGNVVLFDENFQVIASNAVDGATEIIGGRCGDHNDDGSVNVFDSVRSLQFSDGLAEPDFIQSILGDLNFNSGIDLSDGLLGLEGAVGLSPIHECGEIILYDNSIFEGT